jgi:hypothetical protein
LSVVYFVRGQFYDVFEDLRLYGIERRGKSNIVPIDAKKARRRNSCAAPLIPDIGARPR